MKNKVEGEVREGVAESIEGYVDSLTARKRSYSEPFKSPADVEPYIKAFLNYLKCNPTTFQLMVSHFEISMADVQNYDVKYNPFSGTVRILIPKVKDESFEHMSIREANLVADLTLRSGPNLIVSIVDLIRGMTEDFRRKLLENFSSAEDVGGESGHENDPVG